jgi:hypothetical protein
LPGDAGREGTGSAAAGEIDRVGGRRARPRPPLRE